MAFVLPLAELGAYVGSVLTELGVSSEVAAVGGSVVGSQVGSAADNALYSLIPKDKIESFNNFTSDTAGLIGAYETQNLSYFINKQKNKEKIKDPELKGTLAGIDVIGTLKSPGANPKQIASLIVHHSNGLADNLHTGHLPEVSLTGENGEPLQNTGVSNVQIVSDVIGNDPSKLSSIQKLSNYYADKALDNSEEYKKIFAVYNGTGISPENVVMSVDFDNYYFEMYEETGEKIKLVQNKKALTISPLYGVFGGLKSPNNKKPIDYCDTCFLGHDHSYQLKMFSRSGDMKLTSRLIQGRSKWPSSAVTQLNGIVIYFSTLSKSLSLLSGSIKEPTKVRVDNVKDDFFASTVNPQDYNDTEYATVRADFYSQLHNSVIEEHSKVVSSKLKRNITIELF